MTLAPATSGTWSGRGCYASREIAALRLLVADDVEANGAGAADARKRAETGAVGPMIPSPSVITQAVST